MNDFIIENGVLKKYSGSEEAVVVPEGVTVIGENAFAYADNIRKIILPDSVEIIEASAFAGYTNLESVNIPSGVKRIGRAAFYGCLSLEEIYIPDGVERLENSIFSQCQKLKSVRIPESVTYIGEDAFYYCISLKKCVFAGCVAQWCGIEFGNEPGHPFCDVFSYWGDCHKDPFENDMDFTPFDTMIEFNKKCGLYINDKLLTEITPGDLEGVEAINDFAFFYYENLVDIVLPKSVKRIGKSAFSSCFHANIVVPKSVEFTGEEAFRFMNSVKYETVIQSEKYGAKCVNGYSDGTFLYSDPGLKNIVGHSRVLKGEITIPDKVVSIGESAFEGCDEITEVKFGRNLKTICNSAFYGCLSLDNVILPDSLVSIGDWAFSECKSLHTITIPDSVKSFGENIFNRGELFIKIKIICNIGSEAAKYASAKRLKTEQCENPRRKKIILGLK